MVQSQPVSTTRKAPAISESGRAFQQDQATRTAEQLFAAMMTNDNEQVDQIITQVDPR